MPTLVRPTRPASIKAPTSPRGAIKAGDAHRRRSSAKERRVSIHSTASQDSSDGKRLLSSLRSTDSGKGSRNSVGQRSKPRTSWRSKCKKKFGFSGTLTSTLSTATTAFGDTLRLTPSEGPCEVLTPNSELSGSINRSAFSRGMRAGSARQFFTWGEGDELGEGAFGKVFRGHCNYQSNRTVAVKQIRKSTVDDLDQLWAEIHILGELDHPNILRFLEAYSDRKFVHVVTEVCLGGTLLDWMPRVEGDVGFAARCAREVGGALAYCHSRQVCHRDLKLENILLVRNSIDSPLRVSDFGLAKRCSRRISMQRLKWRDARAASSIDLEDGGGPAEEGGEGGEGQDTPPATTRNSEAMVCLTSFKGTPAYMAPEVLKMLDNQVKTRTNNEVRKRASSKSATTFYDFRCDVWSLGVVVHEVLTGVVPYTIEDLSAYVAEDEPIEGNIKLREMVEGSLEPAEQNQWASALDFVENCLELNFRERPDFDELLDHEWLRTSGQVTSLSEGLAKEVVSKLHRYSRLTRFKQAALIAAVRHMPTFEHDQLRARFQVLDSANAGQVSVEALCNTLRVALSAPSETGAGDSGGGGAAGDGGGGGGSGAGESSSASSSMKADCKSAAPPTAADERDKEEASLDLDDVAVSVSAATTIAATTAAAAPTAATTTTTTTATVAATATVQLPEPDLLHLEASVRSVDSDNSGHVDFAEFLAAMMDPAIESRPDLSQAAYRSFDRDGDGTIDKQDLARVFESATIAEQLLRLGDTDEDGDIDYDEFMALLRVG